MNVDHLTLIPAAWRRSGRFAAILMAGITAGSMAMAVEEPKFEVLTKDGSHEVRRYAPVIVAETLVDGDMDAASGKGFRVIADYIFGNNRAAGPVAGAAEAQASEKIAMTAPVVAEPVDGSAGAAEASLNGATRWRIHFVMPRQYTMDTLPRPNNTAVQLRELPPTVFAVVSYSGLNTAARVQQKTEELQRWMASRNLQPLGTPQLARYDPPWTLPMWRRNEVQIQVREP